MMWTEAMYRRAISRSVGAASLAAGALSLGLGLFIRNDEDIVVWAALLVVLGLLCQVRPGWVDPLWTVLPRRPTLDVPQKATFQPRPRRRMRPGPYVVGEIYPGPRRWRK